MTERVREWVVGGIVAALVLGGLALELLADPEPFLPPPAEEVAFVDRADFCPPTVREEGYTQSLVVSGGERATTVGLEPQRPEPAEVAARRIAPVALEEAGGQAVVGYGAPAYAGAVMRATETRRAGAGAAACSGAASERWYFAAGTSAIGYEERILLHNPFPDEAVVRVSLLTAVGEPLNKAGLDDVAVPAGEYAEVDINDFITPRAQFGAEVTAIRGRVVAWKAVIGAARESPHGFELTVGAPEPALRWYFPHGVIGGDVEETIALLNPNDRELTVTVSLASEREAAQPAALIDLPLPPRSSHLVSLAESAPKSIAGRRLGVSVTVSSTNGLPLVAERRLSGSGQDAAGIASELGATSGADAWLLTPAAVEGEDDLVSLMNPSDRDARASLRLVFADRAALSPPPLQRVEVGAGLRTEISLDRWRSAGLAGVLVTSDAPLVAERSAYSPAAGDMADVMGTPLSPKGP